MKTAILTLVLSTFLLMNVNDSLSQVSTHWTRILRQPAAAENENARDMTIDRNGTIYVAGQNHSRIGSAKYNTSGTVLGSHFYNSTSVDTEELFSIVAEESGNYYVAGFTRNANGYKDMLVIKYSPTSDIIWLRTFNGPLQRHDEALSICLGDSGLIYVAGASEVSNIYTDCATLKYDSSGNLLWSKFYNGTGNYTDFLNSVRVDDAGNVYVSGSSYTSPGSTGNDATTIKYNSNGDFQWAKVLVDQGNGGTAMEIDEFGNSYVGTADFKLLKYNTAGDLVWIKHDIPVANINSISDIELDYEGNIVVSGSYFQGSNNNNYFTLKYNPAGNVLWSAQFNPYNKDDVARSVSTDKHGNIYVTGSSRNPLSNNWDYGTVKYDKLGVEKWNTRYAASGTSDNAVKVVCDTLGSVYVTGSSDPDMFAHGYDIVTIKYIQPLPTVTVSPNVSICSGSNTTLTASGAISYEWSPSAGLNTTTGANVIANPTSTTTYTVAGTDANGFTNSASVTVTVNPLPTVTVSPNVSMCTGGSTTLSAGGANSYEWSPSTGLNTTTGATVIANPSSTTTYTVTGTNANGCTNSATVIVTVNPMPTVSVSPDVSICTGSNTTLTASGASSYEWSPSTGLNSTTGANVIANPYSTTTYTVTGNNGNGCTNSATVTVTVNPMPTVTVSPDVSICSGSSATLSGGGATSYEWSPAAGLNTTTGANVIANPSSTTTYTVTGTDATGCTNSATVTVTVSPLQTVNAGSDQSIYSGCLTQNATLTASVSGGNEPFNYLWSPGGETTQSITVSPSSTTTYTVNVTNASGCSSSDQVEVEVIPVGISVNAGDDQSIYGGCVTQSATLSASASGGFGPTYLWSPGGETTQSITVNPSSTTTYSVTVTNSLGCSTSDEVIVNVTPVSIAVDAGEDKSIYTGCTSQSTTITASVTGGFDPTYLWSPGGETTQTISVNPSSTTTYTVTVTNSFGCSASDQVVVNVTPANLSVNAGSDTTIYLGYGIQSTTLTAASSGGYSPTYLWSPGGATTQSITVSPTTTTVYTVQVTNSIGCIATDEVQVNVYDTRCGNNGNKVLVCHNGITICVSESAIAAHLDHGDHLDSCNGGADNIMGSEILSEIPDVYMLHPNFPNPFNPVTTMKYDLPFDSKVMLTVYDMSGREVVTLVNETKNAGTHSVTFNATGLSSGIYFYRLTANGFVQVKKMILLK